MSLASLLNIARSALLTHQRAMDVIGHNVANASTPGYSRQRLELSAADPLMTPVGLIGRGVTDAGVTRVRDTFLDAAYRRSSGMLAQSSTSHDLLSQVQSVLNEPSSTGLASTLDQFFAAFADLANSPASSTSRMLVRQAATSLVRQLQSINSSVAQVASDAVDRMRSQVDEVNRLTASLASLNAEITAAGGPQHQAADLQDRRDLMIDQLSSLMNIQASEQPDGTITVMAGSTTLVDNASAQVLSVQPQGSGFGIGIGSGGGLITLGSGSLLALSDVTTQKVPNLQSGLNQFAAALVAQVNSVHGAGFTLSGATGVNFFDPAGVTASTIAISSAVSNSTDAIAAAATNSPGDNAVALQLSRLGALALPGLGGQSMRAYYTGLAASVGVDVQGAERDTATNQAMVDQADSQRQSVTGVSVDDEMVNLIAQQQAYGAAARLITTANDMMTELLKVV